MNSKWKSLTQKAKDDDHEEKSFNLTPLTHRRLKKDSEERRSLVESEETPEDDEPLTQTDLLKDVNNDKTGAPLPVENIGAKTVEPKTSTPAPPVASKWGKLKSSNLGKQPQKPEPVKVDPPKTEKPKFNPWSSFKNPPPPYVEPDKPPIQKVEPAPTPNATSKPVTSGWARLRNVQPSAPENKESKTTDINDNVPNTAVKKPVSGWGKLKSTQGMNRNEPGKDIPLTNLTTPQPRKIGDLAGVAYAVHATQKITGVLKEKATARAKIKQKLALKERMAKLVAERLTIKQIFKRYVETSTLHGFCYVASDTFLIRRAIWAILMILGAVYFLIKLKDGIVLYFEYPFTTLASTEYVPFLSLPAISFCPINHFKAKNFSNTVLQKIYDQHGLPISRNWTDPGFDVPGDVLYKAIINNSFDIYELAHDCDWVSRDTDHPRVPHRDCGPHNFTTYISQAGEVCYTVNSGKEGHPLLHVSHSGLGYGYEVHFDLRSHEAMIHNQFNGVRVVLHDQPEPPVSSTGFLLTPGFKSFVKMERIETMNLPPPIATKCGAKKLKYHKVYNQKACQLEMLTDIVGKECNCRQMYMPDNGLKYCSLQQEIKCALPLKERTSSFKLMEGCPIDCKVTKFEAKITDSRYLHNPPQGLEPSLILGKLARKGQNKSHILDIYNKKSSSELDVYIEENIVNVIFFFAEMKMQVNEQIRTFSFYNFLGDMGGEIGLMLGASLLTFAEFMDLIIFLLYHQLLRLNKEKKIKRESMILE